MPTAPRWVPLLRSAAFLGCSWLFSGLAWSFHGALLPGRDLPPWWPHEWFSAAAGLFLSWLFLRAEGRTLAHIGLGLGRRWLRLFGMGSLAGVAIILVAALGAWLAGVRWVRGPAGGLSLLAGAWMYLAVGVAEELQFRGYAFQRCRDGLGFWPAQALFALHFVYVHWSNPGMVGATRAWATLNIALAALLFGLSWLRTGSLAPAMGMHFAWNFTQGSLLGFGVSGNEAAGLWRPLLPPGRAWLHGGPFGLEAALPCALACALAILWLASRPAKMELPKEPP